MWIVWEVRDQHVNSFAILRCRKLAERVSPATLELALFPSRFPLSSPFLPTYKRTYFCFALVYRG